MVMFCSPVAEYHVVQCLSVSAHGELAGLYFCSGGHFGKNSANNQ